MDSIKFEPDSKKQLWLDVPGTALTIPATILCGPEPGGTLTISAGVHSREYIGAQALTELAGKLVPEQINGTVLLLHCLNYNGFIQRSPDILPEDGKNLNREFPGDENGTETQKLAAFLEKTVIARSDYIVDLHSGAYFEELTPHVYFHGAASPEVCTVSERIARFVNVAYIYRSAEKNGFYSHAGTCGIPAIILERGGCGLVCREQVDADIADVLNIMRGLGFLQDGVQAAEYDPVVIEAGYAEDAPCSGCWYPSGQVGDSIRKGEVLGEIRDIFGAPLQSVRAKMDGTILIEAVSFGIEAGKPMIAYGGKAK